MGCQLLDNTASRASVYPRPWSAGSSAAVARATNAPRLRQLGEEAPAAWARVVCTANAPTISAGVGEAGYSPLKTDWVYLDFQPVPRDACDGRPKIPKIPQKMCPNSDSN